MRREPRDRPGLQAQRTQLSWERSALGLLASGVILLFRQVEPATLGRWIMAGSAMLLALMLLWFGRRRARRIRSPRDGRVADARVEVLVLGTAVAAFAAGTALVLLPWPA